MTLMNYCLGKKPVRHDSRTLMAKSLMPTMPAAPFARDWSVGMPADIGMMGNDVKGNCTVVAIAHLIQLWTYNATGLMITITQEDIDKAYNDLSPDNTGCDMLTVLNYARNIGIGGYKIGAFVKLDHTDLGHVQSAIDFFGGVYVGADLPKTAQNQDLWAGPLAAPTGDAAPGSWGGHAMGAPKYDRSGGGLFTWGRRKDFDWMWWNWYVSEAYAIIMPQWIAQDGLAPVGLPMDVLKSFLSQLAG